MLAGLAVLICLTACQDDDNGDTDYSIYIENTARFEGDNGTITFTFSVKTDQTVNNALTFSYETRDDQATAGDDYIAQAGTGTIAAGAREAVIEVEVIGEEMYEEDEDFQVVISNASAGTIVTSTAVGTIRNDDDFVPLNEDGYITPNSYPGYTLVWSDEFEGAGLNTADWNYETGNSGWGNNELQNYMSGTSNAFLSNGKLVIEAKNEGGYTSARITTQDKQAFQYGRIDIRAILPQGQGIWPALWMLGEDFSTIGWPHCGEIDIMELVGHQPDRVYGTAHWDNNGSHASYGDNVALNSGVFADEFHVFSIVWNAQSIRWYLDDNLYHTIDITPANLSELKDQPFFFIFNVAVGGDWPGSPDGTTVFPQRMIVDYVRVFQ